MCQKYGRIYDIITLQRSLFYEETIADIVRYRRRAPRARHAHAHARQAGGARAAVMREKKTSAHAAARVRTDPSILPDKKDRGINNDSEFSPLLLLPIIIIIPLLLLPVFCVIYCCKFSLLKCV